MNLVAAECLVYVILCCASTMPASGGWHTFLMSPICRRWLIFHGSDPLMCLLPCRTVVWVDLTTMEFDCYQPYFFDDFDTEEDFYKSTAPSEDIWKKFELLPTPPMSPTRTLHLSPGDKLNWLSKVLGQDEDCEGHCLPETGELFGNLDAHIIRDCMWSSFSASKQLEKAAAVAVRPAKAQCASSPAAAQVSVTTDCVDPASVLTFPASSCRKPASSGSESRSDSSGKGISGHRPGFFSSSCSQWGIYKAAVVGEGHRGHPWCPLPPRSNKSHVESLKTAPL